MLTKNYNLNLLKSIIFVLIFISTISTAKAQESPLSISGVNTLRLDYYGVSGDKKSGSYTSTGFKAYNEYSLIFNRQNTPFNRWRGQFSGVINDSTYRYSDRGFIPERIVLSYEKGDISTPYRIEIGDIYTYFSYRTLQRSLKGMQVEFQPLNFKRKKSILFALGTSSTSWRNFKIDENLTYGISYLVEDDKLGKYIANFVRNNRKDNTGGFRRLQNIFSIAGEKTISVGTQNLTVETEISKLSGDTNTAQNIKDTGFFLQINGKSNLPFTYRIRYDAYGKDYAPTGAGISSNRRSDEENITWQIRTGYQINLRRQNYRDSWKTNNPTDTKSYGINISGKLGSLDFFVQDTENRDKTTDTATNNLNINLNLPKYKDWNSRLGFSYQNTDNQTANSTDTITKQINLNADHPFKLSKFEGSIAPGISIRKTENPANEEFSFSPTVAINLRSGLQNIGYNISYTSQDRKSTQGNDVDTLTQSIAYSFTKGQDLIRMELSTNSRNPDPGNATTSYQFGVLLTRNFEKLPLPKIFKSKKTTEEEISTSTSTPFEISQLKLGEEIGSVLKTLAKNNIPSPSKEAGILVSEKRLFEEINNRQRLALVPENNTLKKVGIIIDFRDTNSPDEIVKTLEYTKKLLLDKYGKPSDFYEKGEINQNLVNNIKNGNFIKTMEWTREGGIIRFGIPQRLDGKIRIEIQFAENFPPLTESRWSIEEVR